MATHEEWSIGYARQASVDFELFERFANDDSVNECHRMQFLQMACEKLVKAYLCGEGNDPSNLQSSHGYVAGTLPIVIRDQALFVRLKRAQTREILKRLRHLANEIEVLAPAIKRGGQRPDNCEYPWEDNKGALHVPLDWTFHPSQLALLPSGRAILKLIRGAIARLLK